ncbi:MAG: YkgJ family cysteine cluster protein [Cytophagia bacterium]|nr:YkgJ family cysteine cluster protein [Cytophagia bacterium]
MCAEKPHPFFIVVLCVLLDLNTIREKSEELREENQRFKAFLKPIPVRDVDTYVQALEKEIAASIDCTTCGNCCKVLEPPVDQDEVQRLAKLKKISTDQFEKEFVGKEVGTGIHFLKCQPCIFLQNNACSIYENRPASCADYPHLHQPNIKYRWKSLMDNYAMCPIVYNVVEALKEKTEFK